MSDAQADELRRHLQHALEEMQQQLDNYSGDDNGRRDLSRRCQLLWNNFAAAGGSWADLG
jgi:hypothetical protein